MLDFLFFPQIFRNHFFNKIFDFCTHNIKLLDTKNLQTRKNIGELGLDEKLSTL
jgi:hypothetical protein